MGKRVIFSDLHFGDDQCSLSNQKVAQGLRNYLRELGQIDELILAGDILDANISTLTTAIEGRGKGIWPKKLGFRKWLSYLLEGERFNPKKIIYIPGNHDYVIWDLLSTKKAFIEPIAKGEIPENLPLMEYIFKKPFLQGIAPKHIRSKFIVKYPDHEFLLSKRKVLVTHGHYLDESQSLFKSLSELIKKENGNVKAAVRKFFIMTAQYQAVANSVSFMKNTRTTVDKIHKGVSSFFDSFGKLRNKPINEDTVKAIEMYLSYFRNASPDIFIFGHTHKSACLYNTKFENKKRLIKKKFEIWNIGSFIMPKQSKQAGTFIVTDDAAQNTIQICKINRSGIVQQRKSKPI